MKLMFVGQENVGKSTFINAFKLYNQNVKKTKIKSKLTTEGSTEGISIQTLDYHTDNGAKVNLSIWDFGGQEIQASTHAFFLTERSIYIIVWKISAEHENSRVPYWLETIRFHAPNSPILLLATHRCAQEEEAEVDPPAPPSGPPGPLQAHLPLARRGAWV
uniref:Roc domain-containing protein n=1 Tax=Arcella intermedia TaxID=1963864 RepID=A0A6B2LNW7_9EUKA